MISIVLFGSISLFPFVLGGSACPPREDIYPCVCTEVRLLPNARFTVVTCFHVHYTSAFETAYYSFRSMDIDRFMMVDCFLEPEKFGKEGDEHQRLPQDWWTNLRIRELEIRDSALSSGFACDASRVCKNSYQTHISIVNSSSTPIKTVCEVTKNVKFAWLACLGRLKYFDFRRNHLPTLDKTFFPMVMLSVEDVNMSHNGITKLEDDVFKNLPKLSKLDLSHNEIQSISSSAFGNDARLLKILDLSYNNIVSLPSKIHVQTPALATLNLMRNMIKKLDKDNWEDMTIKPNIRTIDLRENLIYCDCYFMWFNSSLHINTIVLGDCASPEAYFNVPLRRASIRLAKFCNSTDESVTADPSLAGAKKKISLSILDIQKKR